MKVAAFIPARFNSERFPGKLLQKLAGKPIVRHTWENAVKTGLFDQVWVITDHDLIEQVIQDAGGTVKRSRKNHASGTDRIAEFAGETDADIIINIQADEPFLNKQALEEIIQTFKQDSGQKIDIVSLMKPTRSETDFRNPNRVKVVTDFDNFALYFSRAPIPYPRNEHFENAFIHIGIYAFRKNALMKIAGLPPSNLETIEKLENLRFLQAGLKIKMLVTEKDFWGIDTPEDLEKAEKLLKNGKN